MRARVKRDGLIELTCSCVLSVLVHNSVRQWSTAFLDNASRKHRIYKYFRKLSKISVIVNLHTAYIEKHTRLCMKDDAGNVT